MTPEYLAGTTPLRGSLRVKNGAGRPPFGSEPLCAALEHAAAHAGFDVVVTKWSDPNDKWRTHRVPTTADLRIRGLSHEQVIALGVGLAASGAHARLYDPASRLVRSGKFAPHFHVEASPLSGPPGLFRDGVALLGAERAAAVVIADARPPRPPPTRPMDEPRVLDLIARARHR